MGLDSKPFFELQEADLLELIAEQKPERKVLEFKVQMFGGTDDEKKEFLADVSSFANTAGGYLVFGMEATQGIASALPGMSRLEPDKEKQRIENIVRDSVAQRIAGIGIHTIKLSNGNHALVIHIPMSWGSPHMVTYKGNSRFFARNSAGKYQLDVGEIRQAFLASEGASKKIRNFRFDRLAQVKALQAPVTLTDGAKIVLHCVPLTAFQSLAPIDMSSAESNMFTLLDPAHGYRYNLDGIVAYLNVDESRTARYAQFFRGGAVEYVDDYLLRTYADGIKSIPSFDFEDDVIKSCEKVIRFQQKIGVEPPIFIFLTLLNIREYIMRVNQNLELWAFGRLGIQKIDKDAILIPEITIADYSAVDNLPSLLRPAFDVCWNAAGWPRSMNYDESGKRKTS